MAIKLSSNPTCVLSDADNISPEQRQKINMNLTKGLPGSDISGDKVTVINSDGEVEMKAYSAGSNGVPDVTSNDDGKVLTATYSEGTGSFAWATPAAGGGFNPTMVAQRSSSSALDGVGTGSYYLRTAALQPVSGGSETIAAGWYLVEFKLDYTDLEGSYTWTAGVLKDFDVKLIEVDQGPDEVVLTGTTMPLGMSESSYVGYATAFLHLTSEKQLSYLKATFAAPENARFEEMVGTVKIYSI